MDHFSEATQRSLNKMTPFLIALGDLSVHEWRIMAITLLHAMLHASSLNEVMSWHVYYSDGSEVKMITVLFQLGCTYHWSKI